MNIVWLKLAICAGLILFAGKHVAKYADVIAEKTGLSRLWIGVVLVATATSLPELFTGVGSVVFVNAPDLTVGNLLGANSYNLLNIGLLDLLYRPGPILSAISSGQVLTAAFTLIPVTLAAIGIAFQGEGFSLWSVGNVGIFSVAIFISYCLITRFIYNFEKGRQERQSSQKENLQESKNKYDDISAKKAYIYYGIAAAVIIVSGIWLAYIGKELAYVLRLNESFIGSLFIGFITTLPEITVSIAALLIGAKEIAIANMLGSNLFNMTIIFVDDILYRKAPILQDVSPSHMWSASTVMVMTAIIIVAMVTRPRKKFFGMSWYVPVIFVIFLLGAYFNFLTGTK
ncbi:MAG: sodium:calcium antiporter [Candidatus Omnitrophica bacterium]|nr:sodium:calcium antiporter [Candidatus Omnitrophota bacterium]